MGTSTFKPRLHAAAIHVGISALIAIIAAIVVLWLWYPPPYDQLSGGRELFLLLISVDVVIGPLLTLVVFNTAKPRIELIRDLCVIGLLQIAALSYGLHTVFIARPVACVLEVDRFRVVTANQVLENELTAAPYIKSIPLTGPITLGVRRAKGTETLEAVDMALKGYDTGQRPKYWIPYAPQSALAASRPLSAVIQRYANKQADIETRLQKMGLSPTSARYLPVLARADNWLAIIDDKGMLAGFMPYDGF